MRRPLVGVRVQTSNWQFFWIVDVCRKRAMVWPILVTKPIIVRLFFGILHVLAWKLPPAILGFYCRWLP